MFFLKNILTAIGSSNGIKLFASKTSFLECNFYMTYVRRSHLLIAMKARSPSVAYTISLYYPKLATGRKKI